jgi:hypothetical protein
VSEHDSNPGMRELLERWEWDTPRHDGWCSVRCGAHDDRNASARVNVELGAYTCMACDIRAGSPAVLVMKVLGLSYGKANEYLESLDIQSSNSPMGEYAGKPWTKRSGQKFKQSWHRGGRSA